jgi:hypothetical protein
MHPKRDENPDAERPVLKKDDKMDSLVEAAWDVGWWCEWTSDQHIMCFSTNLEDQVLAAASPYPRAYYKMRSRFRQAGLEI